MSDTKRDQLVARLRLSAKEDDYAECRYRWGQAADQIEADGKRIAELEAALRLFLKLMDDDDYDFGELCEEFVPVVRAALGDKGCT